MAWPGPAAATAPGTVPGSGGDSHPDGERWVIERHLRDNARQYCARAVSDPEVRLLRFQDRAAARLYWYRVGDAPVGRTVVVKVPGTAGDASGHAGLRRPRMLEPQSPETKYLREYQALDLLQRHFSALDRSRFGVVPLLGRIDSARAIVMGEVVGRSLTQLAPPLSRLHPGRPSPLFRRSVENAGAWLRQYHQLQLEGAQPRQESRGLFIESARRYCEHLGRLLSRPERFTVLAQRLSTAADRLLPETLPLGLSHGDFAMRNVLVGDGGRVIVFDTTARWRTPVYADLAKFTLAVRLSRVQVYSHGLAFRDATLRRIEQWLLRGYWAGEPIPGDQVRLYSLLLLLDKWSFELDLPPHRSGIRGATRRGMLNAWYTAQTRQLLRRLP